MNRADGPVGLHLIHGGVQRLDQCLAQRIDRRTVEGKDRDLADPCDGETLLRHDTLKLNGHSFWLNTHSV